MRGTLGQAAPTRRAGAGERLLGCCIRSTAKRVRTVAKDLFDIGELPPIGEVPAQMHAMTVRPDALRRADRRDPSTR